VSSSDRPDLFGFMDAYKVLGVDYAADSSTIRHAHRRLAKQHHPDKYSAGSPEQQQASARMAEINDAYRLIRNAPLRFHRVSRASDPTTPWTDSELDTAIHRAHVNQQFDRWMTVALMAVAVIVVPLVGYGVMPMLARPGAPATQLTLAVGVGMSMVSMVVIWSMLGPESWRTLYKVQLALLIWRMLMRHF